MVIVTSVASKVTKKLIATKKQREENFKGNGNINNFKEKKNVHVDFVAMLYSMSHSFFF